MSIEVIILFASRKLTVFISSSQTQWLFLGRESWSCSMTSLLSCVQSRIHHQHSTWVESGLFNWSSCRHSKVPSLSHLQEFAQVSMLDCCVHTKMNPLPRYFCYLNCCRHDCRFLNQNHRFPLLWSSREAWYYSTDCGTSAFSAWQRLTGQKKLMPPKRPPSLCDDPSGTRLDSENTVELEQSQGEGLVPEVTGKRSHGLADILKAFLLQGWKSKKGIRTLRLQQNRDTKFE